MRVWQRKETYNRQYGLGYDQTIINPPNTPYQFTQILSGAGCPQEQCICSSGQFFSNNDNLYYPKNKSI